MATIIQAPIEIVTPPKRYRAIGHCIYCGRRSGKITEEHIIPFGLAANSLVLPKASCRVCQEATRDFETVWLRHMWWPFRTRIGAPSAKKVRPDNFTLRRFKADTPGADATALRPVSVEQVKPKDFPLVYTAFKFQPPGILVGRPDSEPADYEIWVRGEDLKKYTPNTGDAVELGIANPQSFSRMLAKIAHSFAVAEVGEEAFTPLLTNFIRGEDGFPILRWLGGDREPHPSTLPLHQISRSTGIVGDTRYLIVGIRLFCFMGTPRYYAVVGTIERALDESPLFAETRHTIDIKLPPTMGDSSLVGDTVG